MSLLSTLESASEHDGTGRIDRVAIGDILVRGARRNGAKTALVDDDRRLSYRELDLAVTNADHLGNRMPLGAGRPLLERLTADS